MAEKETYFVLTEQACMQLALKDFGIDVSLKMAESIEADFMELMIRAGHIGTNEPPKEVEHE